MWLATVACLAYLLGGKLRALMRELLEVTSSLNRIGNVKTYTYQKKKKKANCIFFGLKDRQENYIKKTTLLLHYN